MKKLVLISLIFCISIFSFSQQRVQIPVLVRNISKKVVFVRPMDEVMNNGVGENEYNTRESVIGEDIVGRTYYDLQAYTFLGNRMHVYEDGTIGSVWTRGVEGAPNFDDRGTGYNFSPQYLTWLDEPNIRVEDERTGWPSYAPLGENGEIIVAHLAAGLKISTRSEKGTGNWNFQTLTGPTNLKWPRVITTGDDNNTIHILANSYDLYEGQPRALLYYRSSDAGATWDIEAEVLDGTGSDYYTEISADNFVWAEPNEGVIAFLVGDAWTDLFLMKSTDNGDSWDKTVIWEHPYPMFDWNTTITDTFYCVDNSANLMLDNDGMAHVVFGISRVLHPEPGNNFEFFPFTDGIGYWNENMDTFSNNLNALSPYTDDLGSELVENYNLVGWSPDLNGNGELDFITWDPEIFQSYRQMGISTMPSISYSYNGGIFVSYTSTTETYDNGINNLKRIWWKYRSQSGTWGLYPSMVGTNITQMFDECVFPVSAGEFDGLNRVFYQMDYTPGLAMDGDHEYVENNMNVYYYAFYADVNENKLNAFTVSQNNHSAITTKLYFTLSEPAIGTTMSLYNTQGIMLKQLKLNTVQKNYAMDISELPPGLYVAVLRNSFDIIGSKKVVVSK
ncbi:MAG: hypothetical protein QM503_09005 [Bacteroidota bacterium]